MARTNTNTGGGGGGSVNSVTASLPLVSSGGTDPDISINQPDAGQVWYSDQLGVLIGDSIFTRDSVTKETAINQENAGLGLGWGMILTDNVQIPFSGAVLANILDDGINDSISLMGAVYDTGVGYQANIIFSSDNVSGNAGSIVTTSSNIGINTTDGVTGSISAADFSTGYTSIRYEDVANGFQSTIEMDGTTNFIGWNSSTNGSNASFSDSMSEMVQNDYVSEDTTKLTLDATFNKEGNLYYYDRATQNSSRVSVQPSQLITYSPYSAMQSNTVSDDLQFSGTGPGTLYVNADFFTGTFGVPVVITIYQEDGLGIDISSVSGPFTDGETVTGGTSGATGTVVWWDGFSPSGVIVLRDQSGPFTNGETITGGTSGETATIINTIFTNVNIYESNSEYFYRAGAFVPYTLSNGLEINSPSITGNDLGDTWTWLRDTTYTQTFLENNGSITTFGDVSGSGLGGKITNYAGLGVLEMDSISTSMISGGYYLFELNGTAQTISIGDTQSAVNGTKFTIDITSQEIKLDTPGGVTKIGDIGNLATQTQLVISDAAGSLEYTSAANRLISLDGINFVTSIGDIDAYANGVLSTWDSPNQTYTLYGNGNRFISMDMTATYYFQFGDIDGAALGTRIQIDAVNNKTYLGGLLNNNPPAYDDDAAAATAGLVAGDIYQTTGSGAAPLNAPGILMVKQ